ncbi:glycine betaine ABC transporter substrate-binding protein [Haloglomus litoreum]|uniref:glycine betaine ABC transporter substrate-binding protein n=1 Tax=Haloglomus litoreum TaxID=3034026 RepID=UPI0023E8DE33|nr:glycine betaine ABC transporter substrate-binding protein [Haloglomus sp. DT116]
MGPTRRHCLRRIGGVGGIGVASGLCGCTGTGSDRRSDPNVRIGSKSFAEQQILGYLAYHRLQRVDGIQVVDEIGYGGSLQNWNAVVSGVKDLYWEYTGTAWTELPPKHTERITDPQRLYERVRADAREHGAEMSTPAPFSNEWVLLADRGWSERTGVTTISGLVAHLNAGNTDFGVALGEDFYHRQDAWGGMADFYGLEEAALTEIESGAFIVTSIGLTYELVRDGRVQVASGFDTDPQLDRPSLVLLEDDRDYFIPYQPAPTANAATADAYPAILEELEPVAAGLDARTIRRLNRQVLVRDRQPSAVARSFLRDLEGST